MSDDRSARYPWMSPAVCWITVCTAIFATVRSSMFRIRVGSGPAATMRDFAMPTLSLDHRATFVECWTLRMRFPLCALAMLCLMTRARAALPGDSADGKRLHDAHCMQCHDTGVYTRKDQQVRSLDALRRQLQDCSHMAKAQFSPTQMQNVVKYLNEQFYHFR